MKYKVVAVIWNDHIAVRRDTIPDNPESLIFPTITFGVIVKKTKRTILVVHDIERYLDKDDASYTLIFRANIEGIKEFGEIEIDNLRIST